MRSGGLAQNEAGCVFRYVKGRVSVEKVEEDGGCGRFDEEI